MTFLRVVLEKGERSQWTVFNKSLVQNMHMLVCVPAAHAFAAFFFFFKEKGVHFCMFVSLFSAEDLHMNRSEISDPTSV